MSKMLWHKTIGRGPNLVLLHGWGFSSEIFQSLVERYKQSYRITVIDLPGHGRSSDVEGGIDDWCDEIIKLIPDKSTLLGWSLGGLLSIYIASKVTIEHLVLVAATPNLVNNNNWKMGMRGDVFHQFASNLKSDSTKTLKRFVNLQSNNKTQVKGLYEAIKEYPPSDSALSIGLDILLNSDLRGIYKSIRTPKSAILGTLDTLVPDTIENWYKNNNTQTYTLRSGHLPFLDDKFELPKQV